MTHDPALIIGFQNVPVSNMERISCVSSYFGIKLVQFLSIVELRFALRQTIPLALVAELNDDVEFGGEILKAISNFDPSLPTMFVTNGNPRFLGSMDAISSIYRASYVRMTIGVPTAAEIVDLLATGGRLTQTMRLLPI